MSQDKITIKGFEVTFRRVSGVEQDRDSLIDYFAGALGRENGRRPPLTLNFYDPESGEDASVYEIEEVDVRE